MLIATQEEGIKDPLSLETDRYRRRKSKERRRSATCSWGVPGAVHQARVWSSWKSGSCQTMG